MRSIQKGQEPKGWAEYRISTPGATFDGAPKEELRRALLADQGYICCYCMCRIDESSTRIEHRLPQKDPDLDRQTNPKLLKQNIKDRQFNYRNLLAACQGGAGMEPKKQHCDVSKHDIKITIDPANSPRNLEAFLKYEMGSGKIGAADETTNTDLHNTLKLNLDRLRTARLNVLAGFKSGFEKRHRKTWSVESMERELKKWAEIPPSGKLEPYAGIVVHYLRMRIHRASVSP